MRILVASVVLAATVAAAGCNSAEQIPPAKDIGPGVPQDLPALAGDQFAVLGLTVHG